jgi:hypothetical protein
MMTPMTLRMMTSTMLALLVYHLFPSLTTLYTNEGEETFSHAEHYKERPSQWTFRFFASDEWRGGESITDKDHPKLT